MIVNVTKEYPFHTPSNNGKELTEPTMFLTKVKDSDNYVPRMYYPQTKIWKTSGGGYMIEPIEFFMESATVDDVKNSHMKAIEKDMEVIKRTMLKIDLIFKRLAYAQGELIKRSDILPSELAEQLAKIK